MRDVMDKAKEKEKLEGERDNGVKMEVCVEQLERQFGQSVTDQFGVEEEEA